MEAENKSAKPYSSRRTPEGPEKLNITFSYLLSPFSALDLSENRRRIDNRNSRGNVYIGQKKNINLLAGGDNGESRNVSFDFFVDSHGEKMLIKTEYLTVKFKNTVDAEKRFIRKVYVEVARARQETAHELKIMVFLHSAKEFQSVLKLY